MEINQNYFKLYPKKKAFLELVTEASSAPFKIPSWISTLLFGRLFATIILNPNGAPTQRPIHVTKASENNQDELVVVNLKRMPKWNGLENVLLKLGAIFPLLPFAPKLKQKLQFSNPDDRQHVDNMLCEIDKLISGGSTFKNCEGKTFDWSRIHFKGMEFLDAKMRVYFYEQLDKKYGSASYEQAKDSHIEFFTIQTADNAELDSVAVLGPDENYKPISERKFVITCLARDQNYISWVKDLKYTATKLGATAISFNYRSIDLSRGYVVTEQDMINDILAQVERLINLGVKPDNICLDGMCLAATTATIAAAKLHQQNIKVKLNNERSYRTGALFLIGSLVPEKHKIN